MVGAITLTTETRGLGGGGSLWCWFSWEPRRRRKNGKQFEKENATFKLFRNAPHIVKRPYFPPKIPMKEGHPSGAREARLVHPPQGRRLALPRVSRARHPAGLCRHLHLPALGRDRRRRDPAGDPDLPPVCHSHAGGARLPRRRRRRNRCQQRQNTKGSSTGAS